MKNKKKTIGTILIVLLDVIILSVVTIVIKRMEQKEQETDTQNEVVWNTDANSNDGETVGSGNAAKAGSNSASNSTESSNETGSDTTETTTASERPETITLPVNITGKKNECALTSTIYYRLQVVDAAGPDQYYALQQSTDAGATWTIINSDPFQGEGGGNNGVFFLTEQIGFLVLTKSGGAEGYLYRTEDGGVTFTQIELPTIVCELTTNSGISIEPFDLPDPPFVQDGVLYLTYGQGADGDYNANSSALLRSDDQGLTWTYVKEVLVN